MKSKIIISAVLLFSSLLSGITNAGVIVDTNNKSFIDKTTNLEWMDFGVNNGKSYDYVASQLDFGELYYGWSLASKDQVFEMWANAFLGLGAWRELPDYFGTGKLHILDGRGVVGSVVRPITDMMGHNDVNIYGDNSTFISVGTFAGTDGLGEAAFDIHNGEWDISNFDSIVLQHSSEWTERVAWTNKNRSTFLVKDSLNNIIEVPEPISVYIFLFGLFGLFTRQLNN
jgi:hypothetical protein